MRIVDISGPIYTGMWRYCESYPGAVVSECERPPFVPPEREVYCQRFEIGGQTGTYIETRAHVDRRAMPVAEWPLADFFFDAVIVRLADKEPRERIELDEVRAAAADIRPGDAVLLRTGWDRRWRDPDFVEDSPFISREAAEWLIARGPALLGGDIPRFDNVAAPEFPWEMFFERVRFLLAPVVHLDRVIEDRVKLAAFPLKVERAVAAPCRAAVFEGWPGASRAPAR